MRTSSARGRTPSSYWRMRRRWEAFGSYSVLATIPSASRSKKTTTPTRAGRRWDDSYCGRPACLRGGGQATSPDSRHRPQSARVRHRCPGRARGSTVPAGRVFSLKATWLVSSTGRPAVGSAAKHREVQDALTIRPGSCGSSAPRLSWSRPILDIPITQ